MRISDWSSDVCSSELVRELEHGQIGADLQGRLPCEEAAIGSGAGKWSHRDRELFALDMLPCDQGFDHPVDRTFGAILFPFGVDRGVDQAALGIVEAVDMATHLTDDRLQHGDAIEIGRASCRARVCQYV